MINKDMAIVRQEISANPANFRFECHSIVITPSISVFNSENKLVMETSISAMIQDGTCTAEYAPALFKSIQDSLPEIILQAIQNKIKKDE